MVETSLEMFRNRLDSELDYLKDRVKTTFEKAKQDGQTNHKIAFGDFIGFRIGC